jgi:hypothetical protein
MKMSNFIKQPLRSFCFIALPVLFFSCSNSSDDVDMSKVKPVKLEFSEAYSINDLAQNWQAAIAYSEQSDSSGMDGQTAVSELKQNVLGKLLYNNDNSSYFIEATNQHLVDSILSLPAIKKLFPSDVKFTYSLQPTAVNGKNVYALYTLREIYPKGDRIYGNDLKSVEKSENTQMDELVLSIVMTKKGTDKFRKLTSNNIGKGIAILVDGKVISSPMVRNIISDGKVEISGAFSSQELDDLVLALKAGQKWKRN